MPFCGPKLSLCGVVLSAWGIIQLSLMGIFFYIRSVALIEDIKLEEEYTNIASLRKDIDMGYDQNAQNCWIAALLYLVTLCVSAQQFWMNSRTSYRPKMTRHGLNATNSHVYSYHERKKDAKQAGYGTDKMRLGKDAIKAFDCCSLTLQPTKRPVITPQGYIFDKEAIYSFILEKKKTYEKQLKEYERQKQEEMKEFRDKAAQEQEDARERFEETEKNIVTVRSSLSSSSSSQAGSVSNMTGSRKRELPSFWLPSMCPDAKKSKLSKPDKIVYCPMSGKPLKVKELVEVQWTEVKDPDNKKSMISREDRYQCAVTGDTLYNSTPCAVLKTSGHVVTVECVEKIIKKDWTHPLTGQTLSQKDIIPIVRGATGFSAANEQLLAEKERPTNAIS